MAQGTEREWLRPEGVSEARSPGYTGDAQKAGVHETAAMFELRPLSLGEILDRTFALYRSRFWLFAGISSVLASVQVVMQVISLATTHKLLQSIAVEGSLTSGGPAALRGLAATQVKASLVGLVFFLVASITQAATSLSLSEVYLSRPIEAKQALGTVARRWYRWIAIALWQVGSMLWIPLLALIPGGLLLILGAKQGSTVLTAVGGFLMLVAFTAGFVGGFLQYLRNALAVPAAIVEGLTIRAAMRRSKVLAAGAKGRMFVVLLIAGCLNLVVGALEAPATLLTLAAPKQEHHVLQAITLVVAFVGRTVVFPVAFIGLALVYFDQRVRKEAFDLQLLLEGSRGAGSTGAPSMATNNTADAPVQGLPRLE
ncbi:MAG: hypothetical protein ACRYFU_12965 [Janthinobacterium lividum]